MLSSIIAFLAAPFMFKPAEVVEPHKQVLRDAADLMRKSGLAKETLWDSPGHGYDIDRATAFCIQGAILKVATGNPAWPSMSDRRNPTISAAMRAAEKAAGLCWLDEDRLSGIEYGSTSLAHWNNAATRTHADVLSALEKAAA